MQQMDMWATTHRTDRIIVQMVDPNNVDIVRGELTNVLANALSLTFNFNSDNKVSGKISALDDGSYIENSWLRIIHRVPEYNYTNELATLVPVTRTVTERAGVKVTEYTLRSALWAVSDDLFVYHLSCGSGQTTHDVFRHICDMCGRQYNIVPNARNYVYSDSVVYEIGDSVLKILYDIASMANNQLDVDGHGDITLAPYDLPKNRTPEWTLSDKDDSSLVIDSDKTLTDDVSDIINAVIVSYKNQDNEIVGWAGANAKEPLSHAHLGFTRAKLKQVNELEPAQQLTAERIAVSELARDLIHHKERQITCQYFPVRAGEVINYITDNKPVKCLVTNVDVSWQSKTVSLTLREV